MDSLLWLLLIIVFSFIELNTFNMVTIWFAIGSLFSLIFSFFNVSLLFQFWIFIIVTIITLIFTKPLVSKKLSRKIISTNADRIIGMEGIVIDDITKDKFADKVKIMGQEWSAKSVDGNVIEKGKTVTVENIEGVKLIVKLKEMF